MKITRFALITFGFSILLTSCSMFKPKYGCESNGKNVGAEKVLGMEKPPKTKKFKA